MAGLERDTDKNGDCRYHLCFRYGGKRFKGTLKTTDPKQARAVKGGADRVVHQLECGLLPLPAGADLVTFVLSGGDVQKIDAPERLNLRKLFRQYLRQLPAGAMEANSLYTVKIHLKHFLRILGRKFLAQALTLKQLQGYVNKRLKMRGVRGRTLSPTTIKKEITTRYGVWSWALAAGKVQAAFPRRLRYPKQTERPPFQSMEEITEQVERGRLSEDQQRELWDCAFLRLPETAEFLAHVQERARHGFLYPMLVTCAHTGARRGELLRSQVGDFDFKANTVTIREKKRVKGKFTTRRVPLSALLRELMHEWLADNHPGGSSTFCQELKIPGSRKQRPEPLPVTEDEAHDHFRRTVEGSKWEVLRGFHVLRHSFITNMAAANVDQRLIDQWVGHTTEATRRRDRHLVADASQRALVAVLV